MLDATEALVKTRSCVQKNCFRDTEANARVLNLRHHAGRVLPFLENELQAKLHGSRIANASHKSVVGRGDIGRKRSKVGFVKDVEDFPSEL